MNKMKTSSKELVKIIKKQPNSFKIIYLQNKTYKKKIVSSLLDAISYSMDKLGAKREDIYLSISI